MPKNTSTKSPIWWRNSFRGKRFSRLVILRPIKRRKKKEWLLECKCDCGRITRVQRSNLISRTTKSCGCYMRKFISQANRSHGMKRTKEYRAWTHMKSRCYNPKIVRYKRWGGRGIRVCKRWLYSFENFYKDMGRAPSKRHSLDRILNNGKLYAN